MIHPVPSRKLGLGLLSLFLVCDLGPAPARAAPVLTAAGADVGVRVKVTLKPRASSVVAGREAWMDAVFRNVSRSEMLVSFGQDVVDQLSFDGPSGLSFESETSVHAGFDEVLCPAEREIFAVRPGQSLTRVLKIGVASDALGRTRIRAKLRLWQLKSTLECERARAVVSEGEMTVDVLAASPRYPEAPPRQAPASPNAPP